MKSGFYDNIKIVGCVEENPVKFKCELSSKDIRTLSLNSIIGNKKAISDYFINSYRNKYVDRATVNIHEKKEKRLTEINLSNSISQIPDSISYIRNNVVGYKVKGDCDTIRTMSADEFIKINPSLFNQFVLKNFFGMDNV